MLKPRIALTSTGCWPRMAGRNFQLGNAAIIFAVIAAGPDSRTWRFLRLPDASSLPLITMRARGRSAGKIVRKACGPLSVPAGADAAAGLRFADWHKTLAAVGVHKDG